MHEKTLVSNSINGNYKNKGVGLPRKIPRESYPSYFNHL